MKTPSPDDLLTIAELHADYGVPVRTLRQLLNVRAVPVVIFGSRNLRVRRGDWLDYVAARTEPARTDAAR